MENNYKQGVKNVLVINGSPKKKASNTMVVTNAFLKGLNKDNNLNIDIIEASSLKVTPCLGCLSCWGRTAGNCVIKNDDIPMLKEKILNSDIIITSYPLYFFSMPGIMKVITDRLLGMMCTYEGQKAPENGESFHGLRYPNEKQRFILISSCAYTETSQVYESLLKQHDAILGKDKYTPILVPQMKTLVDLHNEKKLDKYLEKFTLAGEHFIENGRLEKDELNFLSKPPFTEGAYKIFLNNFWTSEREAGKQITGGETCSKK